VLIGALGEAKDLNPETRYTRFRKFGIFEEPNS